MVRLQKIISQAGLCSRRGAEKLIAEGKVTVNGKIVTLLGTKVNPEKDFILVNGKAIGEAEKLRYYLFYKPRGYLTSLKDDSGRPIIKSFLDKLPVRVYPVGRLDMDVSGVLILTNDGEMAKRLMHPQYEVSKTYWVKVKGLPDANDMENLRNGSLSILGKKVAKASAEMVKEGVEASFIALTLTEGRHRQVKRMCEGIGHPVLRLKRIVYADFLDLKGLRSGEIRPLKRTEVERLKRMLSLTAKKTFKKVSSHK